MKASHEHRAVFSSPEMYYRALHIISSQRYRLPVRRYVIDLFSVELDANVVAKLWECERRLKAHPSLRMEGNRKSMFGRLGRTRRPEESDDSSEDGEMDSGVPPPKEVPAITLQPAQHIIGFDIPAN